MKEELERLRKNRSYLHRTLKNWEQMLLENDMELNQLTSEKDRKENEL